MGADILIDLVRRYLPQIIGAIVIIGAYFYWHHHVYSQGYDAAMVEVVKRDEQARADAEAVFEKRIKENKAESDEINNRLMGAIESYAVHINNITRDYNNSQSKRMYVTTKAESCRSVGRSTGSNNTESANRESEGIQRSELSDGMAESIRLRAKETQELNAACQEIVKLIESAGMVK